MFPELHNQIKECIQDQNNGMKIEESILESIVEDVKMLVLGSVEDHKNVSEPEIVKAYTEVMKNRMEKILQGHSH